MIAFGEASHARACAILVAITLIACLPGFFTVPPIDRDESRFAQATKQMLETRDFVAIRFQEEARLKKPVGIYWLQAAAAELTGLGSKAPIWVYRLPSLLGAVLGVLFTYWALLPVIGRSASLIAAMLTSATLLVTIEAHIAKTDAALFACSVAALGALARAYLDPVKTRGGAIPGVFWIAIAVGALIKGPITLMVAGLAALALSVARREGRWLLSLRPLAGLVIIVAITGPWVFAIMQRSGFAFFHDSVGEDMLGKVAEAAERHWGPPGYYLTGIWFFSWPAAPFLALSLPLIWQNRTRDSALILLAWLIPGWIVFEAVPTKLPHYVLPLVPALTGLTALTLTEWSGPVAGPWRRIMLSGFWLMPLGAGLFGVGALYALEGRVGGLALAALILGTITGLAAASIANNSLVRAVPVALLTAIITFWGLFEGVVPRLDTIWLSKRMALAASTVSGCAGPLIASAAYHEPSLIFLTRTDFVPANGAYAADFLAQGGCRIAFVDAAPAKGAAVSEATTFQERLNQLGVKAEKVGEVDGRSINGWRARRMELWRPVK